MSAVDSSPSSRVPRMLVFVDIVRGVTVATAITRTMQDPVVGGEKREILSWWRSLISLKVSIIFRGNIAFKVKNILRHYDIGL